MQTEFENVVFDLVDDDEFLCGRLYEKLLAEVEDEAGSEWLICSDETATDRARDYIYDSLWAFNADFLASYTGIDEDVFKALQPGCESSNKAVRSLIEANGDLEDFADEAISADGRGHFLNSYDGNENEIEVDGETYYYYRMN
jgi:hypothetical protein